MFAFGESVMAEEDKIGVKMRGVKRDAWHGGETREGGEGALYRSRLSPVVSPHPCLHRARGTGYV